MPEAMNGDVRLHYEVRGEGLPMLFHTGGGGDARMWTEAGYLQHFPACRALLLDHRGHGESDQPLGLDAHRPEAYVEDVVAVLDDADVHAAVLVGYSSGAATLYRVAARHPDRVLALIALGGVPSPDDDGDDELGALAVEVRTKGTRALIEELSAQEGEPAPAWLIDNLSTTSPDMFALPLEAAIGSAPLWDDAAEITCPVLLVCGEEETSDEEIEAACARIPRAEARVLPSYGHLQAFWHAEVTGAVMAEWLGRQGVRG